MTSAIISAIVVLVLLAAFLREPALLTPVYLLLGAWLIGRWWGRVALSSVRFKRSFVNRAFLNDKITLHIAVRNTGRLPVVWLRLHDSLPIALGPPAFDYALSLRPKESREFEYTVQANKRGVFTLGPLTIHGGDVLGLSEAHKLQGELEALTVYPRVVPLPLIHLPSRTLLGALKHAQPIFEDPSRMRGKRDYANGDSLRRVDWKATAASGRMQIKLFEPSVTVEAMLVLNLNRAEYDRMAWIDGTELAIVVAASLGNWLIEHKQAVGLLTNEKVTRATPMRKGRAHFMHVLEQLAHATADDAAPLSETLRHKLMHLNWATTLIVITGKADDALLDQLAQAQRRGLSPVLIACGFGANFEAVEQRCRSLGIPAFHVLTERDVQKLALMLIAEFLSRDAWLARANIGAVPLMPLFATSVIAFATAIALSLIAIRLSKAWGAVAVPGGRRKHERPTPKLGAIPLFGAFAIAVGMGQMFGVPTSDPNERTRLLGLLMGGAVVFVAGVLDDKFNLPPAPQFLAQGISALIAILSLIFVERFTNPLNREEIILWERFGIIMGYALLVAITTSWFIGMMNTVNWLDGVDGLAASVAVVAAGVTLIHMLREGQYSVALLPVALIGALLGFLVFNFQPARIFMGGGALWLGFTLACIGIMGGAKIALLLLVLGLPIADVVWQVFDRWRQGRSPAASDRGHLHFRLADAGWSARKIVALYVGVSALFGAVALVPQPPLFKLITLVVLFGGVIGVLAVLSKRGNA